MKKQFFKRAISSSLLLIFSLFTNCDYNCTHPEIPSAEHTKTNLGIFYNLETIDLAIKEQEPLSFSFNGKELKRDQNSKWYMSDDLIVYLTKEGKWKATVIGMGGIDSTLNIKSQNNLIQEIHIKTTNEVFPYQDELGPEWPGLYNIGNTCFANSLYKLIARSSTFDQVLQQDKPGEIHTSLRNIVNGIRLGKRSSLNEAAVNRKISEMFLDRLGEKSHPEGGKWNNGEQNDPSNLLMDVISRFSSSKIEAISTQNVEAAIAGIDTTKYIIVADLQQNVYSYAKVPYSCITHVIYNSKCHIRHALLNAPRNLFVRSDHSLREVKTTIHIPIWDHKTSKQLTHKTYKAVAMCMHIGSNQTYGHYVAFINFNQAGWFEHNDRQVNKISNLPVSDNQISTILYELQD